MENISAVVLRIVANSLHVLVLLLLAGSITWAGSMAGLSYEQGALVALGYLVVDFALSLFPKTVPTPSLMLEVLIVLPFILIAVLCCRKDKQKPSADEIGREVIEKSRMLRWCTA